MSVRRRNRLLSGIIGATLLIVMGAAPPAQMTDAAFTDPEPMASGTFTALTLAPPQITSVSCTTSLLSGGNTVVKWRWPASASGAGFTSANAQWQLASGWQSVPTTGPVAGEYTTSFNQAVLTGLLTSVLGGTFTVPVRTAAGTQWTSATSSSFTYKNSLLGILLGPTCNYANGA